MKTSFDMVTLTRLYKAYEVAFKNWESNTAKSEEIFNAVYDDDKDWELNQAEIEEALSAAKIDRTANAKMIEKRTALVDYLTAQIPFAKQMNESMIEVVIDFAKKHVAR